MSFFQLSSILFALCMLYIVRIHQRKTSFSLFEVSLWYFLWIAFIVITIFPNAFIGISNLFYFDRVFDMLVVGAFMVLSFLVVKNHFKYKEIELKIDKLVRDISILNLKCDLKKTKIRKKN